MTPLIDLVADRLPAGEDEVTLTQDSLDAIFNDLLGAQFAATNAVSYTDAVLRELGQDTAELLARSSGWIFHARRSVAQSAISGAVMALLLKAVATIPLSLAIIPAILPYLFQVEKARLSRRNEEILLQLYRTARFRGKSADELYEALPIGLREQIHRIDFSDFLEAVTKTGHAEEIARGKFRLRHPDRPRFTIHVD